MPVGLGLIGDLLVYQEDFYTHRDQLFHLFGQIMESIPYEGHFPYSILVNLMHDDERCA